MVTFDNAENKRGWIVAKAEKYHLQDNRFRDALSLAVGGSELQASGEHLRTVWVRHSVGLGIETVAPGGQCITEVCAIVLYFVITTISDSTSDRLHEFDSTNKF